jgi:hypothetical protein
MFRTTILAATAVIALTAGAVHAAARMMSACDDMAHCISSTHAKAHAEHAEREDFSVAPRRDCINGAGDYRTLAACATAYDNRHLS